MKLKQFFFFLAIISITSTFAQTATTKFEEFASKQDKLFVAAYKQQDTLTYTKLLKEFLSRYNALTEADRQRYSIVLNNVYYNFCCTYALLNNKQKALTYLKKSIDAGFIDYQHINEDTDLANIKNENGFIAELKRLRTVGDYLYILKKAQAFDVTDGRPIPKFTYQSADNPNLIALRKAFNLDSIAGQGTDVFKIVNLLNWIHYLIPHDGMHENPAVKNAMSMIKQCKQTDRGLNCRGLATVLNECYLSLGIKSKIITCLPKDSLKIDNDCHVINMVYSDELKKWLWIDPTNNAYVMNENGELLSIEEVRERLITDRPLLLNPDANWNRQTITKEHYLYSYMAKNLYMLECAVTSEYNMETTTPGKTYAYVKLLPLDFYDQTPAKAEEKRVKSNTNWVTYTTNNSDVFWQVPE